MEETEGKNGKNMRPQLARMKKKYMHRTVECRTIYESISKCFQSDSSEVLRITKYTTLRRRKSEFCSNYMKV